MRLDRYREAEAVTRTRHPPVRRGASEGPRLQLSNRVTGRLLAGPEPVALRGVTHPQVALLARQERTKSPPTPGSQVASKSRWIKARPQASGFRDAYSKISYDVWSGQANVNKVWDFIGGRLRLFKPGNTCAARISYALNYGGAPITETDSGSIYPNHANVAWPDKTSRRKERGDGRKYIVSASYLTKYLTKKWGPADARLKTNADARAFRATLDSDEVAVFAGVHHAGAITEGYSDPYVYSDPGVMPVSAWKLPSTGDGTRWIRAPI